MRVTVLAISFSDQLTLYIESLLSPINHF